MTAVDVVVAAAVGLIAGGYSGLFGVGGGIVLVPALVLLLGEPQHAAEGTSLLVIIPTAIAGARTAIGSRLIDRARAARLALGGIVGAAGGSVVALHVIEDEDVLRRAFGVLVILVALRLAVRPRRPAPPEPPLS